MIDGVTEMVPRDQMSEGARKLRAFYERIPGAPFYKTEFGYYCLERWAEQNMPQDVPFATLFDYDEPGRLPLNQLGWCEAGLNPVFDVKIIEDRGDYEVEQDFAGRSVLYFKGRRNGFMPEYIDHPVKDQKSFEELILWRMNPDTPARYIDLQERMSVARSEAARGSIISQNLAGGYMYLRSLIGPELLLYAFYDQPKLIHQCMQAWFTLADTVIARHQQYVTLDEIFLDEDICYNAGPLISPRMMKEFLLPYYQQLITNIKRRQIDPARHLYVQIDTDGDSRTVIPIYVEAIGMDVMSPFEVASGCDVVKIGRQYPDLAMCGGIDKRILAQGRPAIDAMLEYILPVMKQRGGYYPTCDHGVPEEVPYQDYLYYRQRCAELG